MSILNDYIDEVGSDTLLVVVNKQWVLTALDKYTASIEITLTDAAESSTLPATTNTAVTTLLQTIRNNIKYLLNNKENISNKKTIITNSDTDYPTTKAVKTELNGKMNVSGGTFTGNVSMGSYILTVPTPSLTG